jgi:hypothetical protein
LRKSGGRYDCGHEHDQKLSAQFHNVSLLLIARFS